MQEEIKMTFELFKELAVQKIAEKYPNVVTDRNELRFVKNNAYEGEGEMYDYPDFVYIKTKDENPT